MSADNPVNSTADNPVNSTAPPDAGGNGHRPMSPEVAAAWEEADTAIRRADAVLAAIPDLDQRVAQYKEEQHRELVAELGDRPPAIDMAELVAMGTAEPPPHAIRDLAPAGGIIAVAGEEGDGKTTMAVQIVVESVIGRDVLGVFPCGDRPVQRWLFVDTEQGQREATRLAIDMQARGLEVEPGRVAWLTAGGLDLRQADDQAYIERELDFAEADGLWIDSATNAIEDPKDDVQVKALFNFLGEQLRERLMVVGLTMHPRKRAQGEYGRRFDDLFGSREWKGRLTKAFYIEGDRITCWKDRGGAIARRWPRVGRYPAATLERPGLQDPTAVPFVVREDAPASADPAAEEARVLALVGERPGAFTKTGLAERLGGRREQALSLIGSLLARGQIGPDQPRARLTLVSSEGSEGRLL